LVSRAVRALLWFHPAAWWIARQLDAETELASDDRVLAHGVRPSIYADLLARAAEVAAAPAELAMAFSRRTGLRPRLAAIVDTRRSIAAPAHAVVRLATVLTFAVTVPLSAVDLAPTRDVLTQLMRDGRWDARAYAVIGLAQRTDSVAVARAA